MYRESDSIEITFDDGPHPQATENILKLLDRVDKKAVFFLIGQNVKRYPDVARKIADHGHTLGNHSYSHCSFILSSEDKIEKELLRCQEVINEVTGVVPACVRPPYGHRNRSFDNVADGLQLSTMMWTVNTFDYLNIPANLYRLRLNSAGMSDIVLSHDRYFVHSQRVTALETWLRSVG